MSSESNLKIKQERQINGSPRFNFDPQWGICKVETSEGSIGTGILLQLELDNQNPSNVVNGLLTCNHNLTKIGNALLELEGPNDMQKRWEIEKIAKTNGCMIFSSFADLDITFLELTQYFIDALKGMGKKYFIPMEETSNENLIWKVS